MTALRFVDPDDPANDAALVRRLAAPLHGQDRRAIEAIWDLIARPTINLTSDEASLAQAALVFQARACWSGPTPATSATRSSRCRQIHDVAGRRGAGAGRGRRAAPSRRGRDRARRRRLLGATGRRRCAAGRARDPGGAARAARRALLPDGARRRPRRLARGSAARRSSTSTSSTTGRCSSSRSPPGSTRPVQWVFDRTASSGLTRRPVPRRDAVGRRRRARRDRRRQLRERYLAALAELLPAARDGDGADASSSPVSTRRRSARPPGSGRCDPDRDRAAGPGAGRRVDRHRLAGDDGGRGPQRPRGRPSDARRLRPGGRRVAGRRSDAGMTGPRRRPRDRAGARCSRRWRSRRAPSARGAPWADVRRTGMGPRRAAALRAQPRPLRRRRGRDRRLLRRARPGARARRRRARLRAARAGRAPSRAPTRRSSPACCAAAGCASTSRRSPPSAALVTGPRRRAAGADRRRSPSTWNRPGWRRAPATGRCTPCGSCSTPPAASCATRSRSATGTVAAYRSLRRAASLLEDWASMLADREVVLASPRASCAGVDRAVEIVERALEQSGRPVYVRKQIVHNAHVVGLAASAAARCSSTRSTRCRPGATVVFSAHGVSPEVRRNADARQLNVIDATCPLVAKVHAEARRFAAGGFDIVLVGHEGHEEIEGTVGEAPEQTTVIASSRGRGAAAGLRSRARRLPDPDHARGRRDRVGRRARCASASRPRSGRPSEDICYATQNRQDAVRALAERLRPGARRRLGELVELATAGRGRAPRRLPQPAGRGRVRAGPPRCCSGPGGSASRAGASAPEELVSAAWSRALAGLGAATVSRTKRG